MSRPTSGDTEPRKTLTVPESVHKLIRVRAAEAGTTNHAVVKLAMDFWLDAGATNLNAALYREFARSAKRMGCTGAELMNEAMSDYMRQNKKALAGPRR